SGHGSGSRSHDLWRPEFGATRARNPRADRPRRSSRLATFPPQAEDLSTSARPGRTPGPYRFGWWLWWRKIKPRRKLGSLEPEKPSNGSPLRTPRKAPVPARLASAADRTDKPKTLLRPRRRERRSSARETSPPIPFFQGR